MSQDGTENDDRASFARLRGLIRPGVVGSFVLHAAVLALLLYEVGAPPLLPPLIPVDVVPLAEETTSPSPRPDATAAPLGARAPQRQASVTPPRSASRAPRPEPRPAPQPAAPPSAELPAPDALPPAPIDPLQRQLEALAKLRIQNSVGTPQGSSSSAPAGPGAGYRVEDLIRAQVQRRWNLRLDELGERELTITLHVVLEPDGTVVKAEIVDNAARGKGDEVYRSIALSARNAVLLSSPLTLPAGMTDEMRDMTLRLNTRDTLR